MRLACLFLLLTLAASCVAPSPTAPGTPVRNTPGANALYQQVPIGLCEDYPEESTSFAHVRDDMEKLQALGVNVLRVSLPWDSIEPEDDRFDFHFWDHFMEDAAAHGVKLIPYVAYTPAWAVRKGAAEPWHEPPLHSAKFEQFLRVLAARYAEQIDSWEIWNEPDNPAYWSGTAAQFADLVHAGARAIRAADPTARIVLGGIAWNTDYLEKLFTTYGVAPDVDVVNIHSYAETWSGDRLESLPAYIERAWRIVHDYGEDERLWVAEAGYSSFRRGNKVSDDYTPTYDYEHTARFQAVALLRMLVLMRSTSRIDLIAWYRLRDLKGAAAVIGDTNNRHLGIFGTDGRPKPASESIRFARRLLDEPLRVADDEVAVSSTAGQAPYEIHAFAREDGSLVIFAWIPTNDAKRGKNARQSAGLRGAELRSASLRIGLSTNVADAGTYDALGRALSRVTFETDGDKRILPLHLRAGDVTVATVGVRDDILGK